MANETTASKTTGTETVSFWKSAQQFVKVENKGIESFLSGLTDAKTAFAEKKFTPRSWVKEALTGGFTVKLGKIETKFSFPDAEAVNKFLDDAGKAAKSDADFKEVIEAAYAEVKADQPKGKRTYTRRTATTPTT